MNISAYSASSSVQSAPPVQPVDGRSAGFPSNEFTALKQKALRLLNEPELSNNDKIKISSLLARGQKADDKGALGEIRSLANLLKGVGPSAASESVPPAGDKVSLGPVLAGAEEENKVVFKDGSNDVGVSFKFPVAVGSLQAPLAVRAHEGEHVIAAQARAAQNNQKVSTYVSVHYGYDNQGRRVVTGGTTKAVYRSRPEPVEIDVYG